MANVAIVHSASVEDGLGRRKTTEAYGNIVDTTTLAQLAAAQGTWLTDLDGIIDGAIVANRVTIKPAPPGGLKVPGTGATFLASRVSQLGLFRFSASGTSRSWSSDVPSISDSLIVGDSIDTTAGAVGTYTTLLTGGTYSNPENQQLLALEAALLTFRKSKRV
jgi:hypothetical protein